MIEKLLFLHHEGLATVTQAPPAAVAAVASGPPWTAIIIFLAVMGLLYWFLKKK